MENDPADGCDYDYECAKGYSSDPDVIRTGNANASCCSTVLTSTLVEGSQNIGDLESGSGSASANGDECVHDGHDYGSLPMLAEHRMKPCSAISGSDRAVKPVQLPPIPA